MIRIFTLLAVLTMPYFLHAQKRYTNPEKAKELKNYYPDASVVASNYSSQYTFKIDNDNLVVEESEQGRGDKKGKRKGEEGNGD